MKKTRTISRFLSRLLLPTNIIILLLFELALASSFPDKNSYRIDNNVTKKNHFGASNLPHNNASQYIEKEESDLNNLNKWNNNNNSRKEEMLMQNEKSSTTAMNTNSLRLMIPSPEPIHHPCDSLLNQTSEVFSEFYKCSIHYARPYRFCEKCYSTYSDAISVYDQIEYSQKNKSLFDCKKYLLESDNSPVIQYAIANIVTIWDNAYCDHCFTEPITSENDSILSNSTVKFFELYKNLTECISLSILNDNPVDVCKSCHDSYKSLNHHFNEIEKVSSSTVCMDIMDRMNYTRIQWSKNFNCSTTRPRDAVLISSIVTMGVTIPAVYYISSYIALRGVAAVREKFVRRSNGQSRMQERRESNETIEENQGLISPSVSSSQT